MRSKRSLKLTLSSICWYCALGSRRYRLQRRSGGCLEFRCQAGYQDWEKGSRLTKKPREVVLEVGCGIAVFQAIHAVHERGTSPGGVVGEITADDV